MEKPVLRLLLAVPAQHRAGEERKVSIPIHVAGEEFASPWALPQQPGSEREPESRGPMWDQPQSLPKSYQPGLLASAPTGHRKLQGNPRALPLLSRFLCIFQKGQMFLQPEPEPDRGSRSLGAACRCLPTARLGSARRSLQPLALVVKRDSWPCSCWPLGSGLLAIPRASGGGENQTLLIDFPNLMIEYWVSIDRRRAIFIHDFRRGQEPRRPPRSCRTTSVDELTPCLLAQQHLPGPGSLIPRPPRGKC